MQLGKADCVKCTRNPCSFLWTVLFLLQMKCCKYWPDDTELYGDIKITLLKTETLSDYTVRTFSMERVSHSFFGKEARLTYTTALTAFECCCFFFFSRSARLPCQARGVSVPLHLLARARRAVPRHGPLGLPAPGQGFNAS